MTKIEPIFDRTTSQIAVFGVLALALFWFFKDDNSV
jgi:hypothetical protein